MAVPPMPVTMANKLPYKVIEWLHMVAGYSRLAHDTSMLYTLREFFQKYK